MDGEGKRMDRGREEWRRRIEKEDREGGERRRIEKEGGESGMIWMHEAGRGGRREDGKRERGNKEKKRGGKG
jgi:hypothetical protein